MSRSRLKHALKTVLKTSARATSRFSPGEIAPTRILTYHSVGSRDHEMNVSPEAFEEQMGWLSENATVISLEEAVGRKPGVALTFDDGYLDNLTVAAPILRSHRFSATVFVVPGRVGGYLDHDHEDESSRLMSGDEIKELRNFGITIGGHTLTHPRLSTLTDHEQEKEIVGSREILKGQLGDSVRAFAYPFGSALDYNETSIEAVQRAGYTFALSNRYGPVTPESSQWELPRIWIDRSDTLETFQQKVRGELDALALLDSRFGIHMRRMINRLIDPS